MSDTSGIFNVALSLQMTALWKTCQWPLLAVSSLQCNALKIAVPPAPTFDHETLHARQRQMPNLGFTGPQSDLDVVTEPRRQSISLRSERLLKSPRIMSDTLGMGDAHAPLPAASGGSVRQTASRRMQFLADYAT